MYKMHGCVILTALLLTGCGGGGNENQNNVINNAPIPLIQTTTTSVDTITSSADVSAILGKEVVLDATGSSDADKDPISFKWQLDTKPKESKIIISAVQSESNILKIIPDAIGLYQFILTIKDSKGSVSQKKVSIEVNNTSPDLKMVVLANMNPVNSGSHTISTSVGYTVALDGSQSVDTDNDNLSFSWAIKEKPATSVVNINTNIDKASFIPDKMGRYIIELLVKDSKGASSFFTETIEVNNNRPVANISSNALPIALPTGPTVLIPTNTKLILQGNNSIDPDGDSIVYSWSIVSAPLQSIAKIKNLLESAIDFTPDLDGSYTLRLKVTDSKGAFSEKDLVINTGNNPPTAVLERNFLTVVANQQVNISGISSFDTDGDPLTYQWSVDAKPNESALDLSKQKTDKVSFVPDVPGMYSISLIVSDGKHFNSKSVSMRVVSKDYAKSFEIFFTPSLSKYSIGIDKLISIDQMYNKLKIIDPFTKAVKSVDLIGDVRHISISPNGKLASILFKNKSASLIDLEKEVVIKTIYIPEDVFESALLDSGIAYFIGNTLISLDLKSGVKLFDIKNKNFSWESSGYSIHLDKKKMILAQGRLYSPFSTYLIEYDDQGQFVKISEISDFESFRGDFLAVSESQNILFKLSGSIRYSSDLSSAGALPWSNIYRSMSYSDVDKSLIVTQLSQQAFPPYSILFMDSYFIYSGYDFSKVQEIKLPLINGQQAYAMDVFHSANGRHVILSQVGSQYYILYF